MVLIEAAIVAATQCNGYFRIETIGYQDTLRSILSDIHCNVESRVGKEQQHYDVMSRARAYKKASPGLLN